MPSPAKPVDSVPESLFVAPVSSFADSLTDQAIGERVAGPFKGYFVAAYACPSDEGFIGYYKICRADPPNYWEGKCVLKGSGMLVCPTPEDALEYAVEEARMDIELLPPLASLAISREDRGFYAIELRALGMLAPRRR